MNKTRLPFALQPNGEWTLPCSCRLHVWDGEPYRDGRSMKGDVYHGKLAPHLHPCAFHEMAYEVCACGDSRLQYEKDGACRVCCNSKAPWDGCTKYRSPIKETL